MFVHHVRASYAVFTAQIEKKYFSVRYSMALLAESESKQDHFFSCMMIVEMMMTYSRHAMLASHMCACT